MWKIWEKKPLKHHLTQQLKNLKKAEIEWKLLKQLNTIKNSRFSEFLKNLKISKTTENRWKTADSTAEKFEKGWNRKKTVETTEYNQILFIKHSIQS